MRTVRSAGRAQAAALILVALNLRIAIAAVSPLLRSIERGAGLSTAAAGLLTTVPVICFGIFALSTPRLIVRFGMSRLLALAMAVVTVGIAIRLAAPVVALFVGTAVLGSGIAVGNVLLPGIIKRDFHRRAPLMLALYAVSLNVGAALPAGLTVPIQHALGLGWRQALALWGIAALLSLALWAPYARVERAPATDMPEAEPVGGLWRDRVAWLVTLFMGLQSFGFYATLSWLPTLFEDHHMHAARAGWMLSYSTFPGMAGALLAPLLARRRGPAPVVVGSAACYAVAYAGLIADPVPLAYLWATVLGFAQGLALNLALGFIVARARDSHQAAHLSTMAQGVGYLLASAGPFLLGALHDLTGGWTVPLLMLVAVMVPFLACGLGAGRNRYVLER